MFGPVSTSGLRPLAAPRPAAQVTTIRQALNRRTGRRPSGSHLRLFLGPRGLRLGSDNRREPVPPPDPGAIAQGLTVNQASFLVSTSKQLL
jgi:hypothetical protein